MYLSHNLCLYTSARLPTCVSSSACLHLSKSVRDLSLCLRVCLSVCLSSCLPIYRPVLLTCLPANLSVCLSKRLYVCPPVSPSFSPFILFVRSSVCPTMCLVINMSVSCRTVRQTYPYLGSVYTKIKQFKTR